MKYQLISDVHGRFKKVSWDNNADIVLAAGDISENLDEGFKFLNTSPIPVLFIPGNHEYYKGDFLERHKKMKELCDASNGHITFIDREVVHLEDTRIIATSLWSGFNNFDPLLIDCAYGVMNDYRHILISTLNQKEAWRSQIDLLKDFYLENRKKVYNSGGIERLLLEENFSCRQKSKVKDYDINHNILDNYNPEFFSPFVSYLLNKENTHWLEQQLANPFDGKTLVMTHHAPSQLALSMGNYIVNPRGGCFASFIKKKVAKHKIGAYTNSLERLGMNYKIDGWVHGHFHEHMNYRLGSANVICNPTGTRNSDTSGYETYVFNLDDTEKVIGLKNLLNHFIKTLSNISSWLEYELRYESKFDYLNFSSILIAIWEEIEIILISLKSLPNNEIPTFINLDITNPILSIEDLSNTQKLLTYDLVRIGIRSIDERIQSIQPQIIEWLKTL